METTTNDVLKKEDVGYLKSALNMQQGTLVLTPSKLFLKAHKTAVGNFGLIGLLLKKNVEKDNTIFDLDYKDIRSINRGKHGVQTNVLEINDGSATYRIIVKNYQEWDDALKQRIK
jgi:hypothetical protein